MYLIIRLSLRLFFSLKSQPGRRGSFLFSLVFSGDAGGKSARICGMIHMIKQDRFNPMIGRVFLRNPHQPIAV